MALSRCRQRFRPARYPLTSSRHGGAAASGYLALFSLHRLHRWLAPIAPAFPLSLARRIKIHADL